MYRKLKTRVIPCLLLMNHGLVKTVKFREPKYVGDPINAVKIFNEKEVDELIFLDITATRERKRPNFELISSIATECFMPFCYGGGIRTIEDAKALFSLGAEKISINSNAMDNPDFVKTVSGLFGNQSIVVGIDVKKNIFGKYKVYHPGSQALTDCDPVDYAVLAEKNGAGEILLNSVDRDGTMTGYDLELIRRVSERLSIPLIALGGAGSAADLADAVIKTGASAVAAGSLFVFYGKHRAVLINYPGPAELDRLFLEGIAIHEQRI